MRQILQQSRGKGMKYFKWLFFHNEQLNEMIHLGHIKYYDILVIVQKYINKDNQGQARPYQKIMLCVLCQFAIYSTQLLFLFYSCLDIQSQSRKSE